jgi:hypothetical protein
VLGTAAGQAASKFSLLWSLTQPSIHSFIPWTRIKHLPCVRVCASSSWRQKGKWSTFQDGMCL